MSPRTHPRAWDLEGVQGVQVPCDVVCVVLRRVSIKQVHALLSPCEYVGSDSLPGFAACLAGGFRCGRLTLRDQRPIERPGGLSGDP